MITRISTSGDQFVIARNYDGKVTKLELPIIPQVVKGALITICEKAEKITGTLVSSGNVNITFLKKKNKDVQPYEEPDTKLLRTSFTFGSAIPNTTSSTTKFIIESSLYDESTDLKSLFLALPSSEADIWSKKQELVAAYVNLCDIVEMNWDEIITKQWDNEAIHEQLLKEANNYDKDSEL